MEDERGRGRRRGLTEWFANTAVQAGLTIIGVVLLIFAVGQAVGLPLLEFTVDALSSQTGRWLVVAFFALAIIVVAVRGFGPGTSAEPERETERERDRDRNR